VTPVFLVLNSGSSSLKFQVFEAQVSGDPRRIFRGQFEGLGREPRFTPANARGEVIARSSFGDDDRHEQALNHLATWLRKHSEGFSLAGVGQRVVHCCKAYSKPVKINEAVLEALERLIPLAPLHRPHNLEPIRILRRRFPEMVQIACFDTAFHHGQPELAQLFAIPRSMSEAGARRYRFHGLSYAFLASVFGEYDPGLANGRVVAAHLGNGASLGAIRNGTSIATTMGFRRLTDCPWGRAAER
jgi:acetate kinase